MITREETNDPELFDEILWVMKHYGSDAGDRQEPGSKLASQAARIVKFVTEREAVNYYIRQHQMDTVQVIRHYGKP